MLTNRKKIKNRKKKIKIVLASLLFVIFALAVLGYFLRTLIMAKNHYVSPLPLALSTDSSNQSEKNIEDIKDKLNKEKIEFLSIQPSDSSYIIHQKDDKEIILSSKKDINAQISSLQFMLSRLTMEGRQFSRLDLRFDKSIIVFK